MHFSVVMQDPFNSLIQSYSVNKESYRIHSPFIEASCNGKIASVVHFDAFFILGDTICCVQIVVILISSVCLVFSVEICMH